MFSIAKWLTTGITFVLLRLKENSTLVKAGKCIVVNLYADCVHKLINVPSLPRDLQTDIEVLNISGCRLKKLTENELEPYNKLKELVMANTMVENSSPNMFDSLTQLEKLNLSGTSLPSGKLTVKVPSTIKQFIAENFMRNTFLKLADVEEIDFSESFCLEQLHMRKDNLENFPFLPQTAPVTFLDFSENPLTQLKYSDIAPFCNLKEFRLDGSIGLSKEDYLHKQCCGVKSWLIKYNITSNLLCGNCTEEVFDSSSVEAYKTCKEVKEYEEQISFIGQLTNIIVCTALVLGMVYLAFRFYRSRAKRYKRESNKKDEEAEDEEDEAHIEEALED